MVATIAPRVTTSPQKVTRNDKKKVLLVTHITAGQRLVGRFGDNNDMKNALGNAYVRARARAHDTDELSKSCHLVILSSAEVPA